tara:strand:- start:201 stop:314 length:114 start_codon:yes stop_codon:yes gene_type:complete
MYHQPSFRKSNVGMLAASIHRAVLALQFDVSPTPNTR